MKIEELATVVLDACAVEQVEHMLTGAFAVGYYGIPRSTKDVDVVLNLRGPDSIDRVINRLSGIAVFDPQWQFDTLTWGRRLVGAAGEPKGLKVELFELFGDAFVQSQFHRKLQLYSSQLGRLTWLPTPEDVLIQKIRWGRPKDLEDARDVLAVQTPEKLDMAYVRLWCTEHKTTDRLDKLLTEVEGL